jgi:hypothetical protein
VLGLFGVEKHGHTVLRELLASVAHMLESQVLKMLNEKILSSNLTECLIYQANWPILGGVRHGAKRPTP